MGAGQPPGGGHRFILYIRINEVTRRNSHWIATNAALFRKRMKEVKTINSALKNFFVLGNKLYFALIHIALLLRISAFLLQGI